MATVVERARSDPERTKGRKPLPPQDARKTLDFMSAASSKSCYRSCYRSGLEAFLSEDWGAALMHGPTFMANPLACAAANASLDLFEQEPRAGQVQAIEAGLLSVGQIYLYDNPLLRTPLGLAHLKPRLLGHWGTTPGQNFIYVHLNRIIRDAPSRRGPSLLKSREPRRGRPGR